MTWPLDSSHPWALASSGLMDMGMSDDDKDTSGPKPWVTVSLVDPATAIGDVLTCQQQPPAFNTASR